MHHPVDALRVDAGLDLAEDLEQLLAVVGMRIGIGRDRARHGERQQQDSAKINAGNERMKPPVRARVQQ